MDALYKFSAFAGTPPRRVRHAEGGAHAPVRSTDRRVARSSPTRREYFVRNHRPAGARPDPAGQYANPYTYGGDPVNYVDPAGLFSFDTGLLTIGWTSSQGWSIGLTSGPFSYGWNTSTNRLRSMPAQAAAISTASSILAGASAIRTIPTQGTRWARTGAPA